MKKHHLFIVGATKAGITSLYHYLNQHPQIYLCPIKEPHHFCTDIRCVDFNVDYRRLACFDLDKYFKNEKLQKKHIAFVENRAHYLELFREIGHEIFAGEVAVLEVVIKMCVYYLHERAWENS